MARNKYLPRTEALKLLHEYSIDELKSKINESDYYCKGIRDELVKRNVQILFKYFRYNGQHDFAIKDKKKYDLLLALEIYDYFNNEFIEGHKFTLSDASNEEFWTYVSVLIVPDIVNMRWGSKSYNRYCGTGSRIYLSYLWWYVHLSWQGSKEETYKVLNGNTTDIIMNLVDRAGPNGYRIDLSRKIMYEYSKVDRNIHSSADTTIFRRIMVINNSQLSTMEPSLYNKGVDGYVDDLFKQVGLVEEDGKYV